MHEMNPRQMIMVDGNEATARVAYKCTEVCAIYPITPSSTMSELADEWANQHQTNIWGNIPLIVEMQSEGGAAGAVHGSLQTGALATTFTSSQGLMLMIPNMYKIAGELTPAVFHVAARSLAAQGLSIFGDHQDVMAVRSTGFALLASNSVQEAQDMALVAHAATLESRIPFVHFFDGFRTSHEVNKIEALSDTDIRELINDKQVIAHRSRALNPDHPIIRGTAQNPDLYFQGRETVNLYYQDAIGIVQQKMNALGERTGRNYKLFEFYGAADARRLIIIMGSGSETVKQTVEYLNQHDDRVGVVVVRLFRPFSMEHLIDAIPDTVETIAVLDRTKEPGAFAEPLFLDVSSALYEATDSERLMPTIIGGRYGLSSKEFTPAMVKAIFDELGRTNPKRRFTVGIHDDVSHLSLEYDPDFDIEPEDTVRAMFFGLGSDGTVGANKNSIKIIGQMPEMHAQGYFVYDSKKSGSQTVSHLRFGHHPISAPYLLQSASFIACHHYPFIHHEALLEQANHGAIFLLNSHHGPEKTWDHLPFGLQQQIIDKQLKFYVIDAFNVASETGMGRRINTVMQTCFFALAGVLPREQAIDAIKAAAAKTYAGKGQAVVEQNCAAIDNALEHLYRVSVPACASSPEVEAPVVSDDAPGFVQQVTSRLLAGQGDLIPVSMVPVDGSWPTATTRYEKRDIAQELPNWLSDRCIQCGNCSIVCPHAAIRAKFMHTDQCHDAPDSFESIPIAARGFPDTRYRLQVYPADCTGCGLCVQACPVRIDEQDDQRALAMVPRNQVFEPLQQSLQFYEQLPVNDRSRVEFSNVRGVQYLEPLFEFSGACSGCGETPYLKLITQLFGDRLLVANATGCSSIYGGNLPTTPWATNQYGRGPAWANSLFEDNAEFGLGFRMAASKHLQLAQELLNKYRSLLGDELVDETLLARQQLESDFRLQRIRLERIQDRLKASGSEEDINLLSVLDHLIRRSIWIIGGDGWAYDIGSAGVDHVLASGEDVNVLVMDTEVYSNTGGQMSKSTPLGAVAKFAAGGKTMAKKDVALQAISYGNVYVARIALGGNPQQALQALREAEAYDGPSLIIAYSHCIAHGIDMSKGMTQQKLAVDSGHWPLFRYNPVKRDNGVNPFTLDSLRPSIPLAKYRENENRYQSLAKQNPDEAIRLMDIAQKVIDQKWAVYEEMATRNAADFHPDAR